MTTARHNFIKGLIFSSIMLLFWGALPIALKLAAEFTDAITLTWFRFCVALIFSFCIQGLSGKLYEFSRLNRSDWVKLIAASVFLVGNYTTFASSLLYISAGTAQLNFQLAPFFLVIGGILFFSERVNGMQWISFLCLALGLLLFFYDFLSTPDNTSHTGIYMGVLLAQLSAVSWSVYALLQKFLIKKISPNNILLSIYFLGCIIMLPFIDLHSLQGLNTESHWVLITCSLNTVIAYGALAQALKYWSAVQVSSMVALTPVLSFSATSLCVALFWWPDIIKADNIDALSLSGIALVLASAISIQIFGKYKGKFLFSGKLLLTIKNRFS